MTKMQTIINRITMVLEFIAYAIALYMVMSLTMDLDRFLNWFVGT